MPNRILRDCTDSIAVNSLSDGAEKFFYRLIQKADDFGRYHGEAALLRPLLYPRQLDKVREADIQRWIMECVAAGKTPETAGLVRLYQSEGKLILEITKFNQQIRSKQSKFPGPDPNCAADAQHVHSRCTAHAHLVGDGDGDGDGGVVGASKPPFLEKKEGWQLRKDLRETTDPVEREAIKAELKRRAGTGEQLKPKPPPKLPGKEQDAATLKRMAEELAKHRKELR